MRSSRWRAHGNTYLVTEPLPDASPESVRALVADADGLVEVWPSPPDTVRGTDLEQDGSRAGMSGNATRIAAAWLRDQTGAGAVRVDVGEREVVVSFEDGLARQDLGRVTVGQPEEIDGIEFSRPIGGQPAGRRPRRAGRHRADRAQAGGALRFPERTNVQVARVDAPGKVTARVWEARGGGDAVVGLERGRRRGGVRRRRDDGRQLPRRRPHRVDRGRARIAHRHRGARRMKVAALYDIHGNLPALEAVPAEPDVRNAHRIVVGGDLVTGPFPRETFDLLLGAGFHSAVIRGNCERELEEDPHEGLWGERTSWVREQLSSEQIERLLSLPESVSLDIDLRGPVFFCHASPRSDDEILTRATPPAILARRRRRSTRRRSCSATRTSSSTSTSDDPVRQRRERRDAVRGGRGRVLGASGRGGRAPPDAVRPRPRGVPDPHQRLPRAGRVRRDADAASAAEEATAYFEQAAAERGERHSRRYVTPISNSRSTSFRLVRRSVESLRWPTIRAHVNPYVPAG